MEIVLAWTAYLGLGVLCVSLAWAWLAPRLPRAARLAVLGLLGGIALLALAVTAYLPHDYRLGDIAEDSRAMQALGTQLLVAMAGGTASLAAIGRRLTQNARLFGAGVYLVGVGLCLYVILEGQATLQAPILVLVGSAVMLAAAARLSSLPRWPARAFGLAGGPGVALAVEALRGPGSRGGGPTTASADLLPFVEIGAFVLIVAGVRFLGRHGGTVAGSLNRAAIGIAGTALVLLLRGPGEWAPSPGASSTTLYGLPLTLLVLAVTLVILEQPTRVADRAGVRRAERVRRRSVAGWAPLAGLALLVALPAVWHPVPEPCTAAPYANSARWALSPQPSAPRGAPGLPEFDQLCTHRAQNLSQIVYAVSPGCKWAQVDPHYPLVQASGTLRRVVLSNEDSPWLHTSHDLGLEVQVDAASSWLLLGGPSPGALLHVEVESGPFPEAYRPVAGERVTVAGRWVFDCGHDPKTELHPAAVVASEYDEWRSDAAGGPQQVHVVRVWMNSQPGLVHVPLAPFDLRANYPSRPAGKAGPPVVQVSAGPSTAVQWTVGPGNGSGSEPQAAIYITPPASEGSAYFELLLSYREGGSAVVPPATYQVTFDRLLVTDNLRSAARNTTGLPNLYFPQIGFAGSGKWNMQIMVGPTWRSLLAGVPVVSGQVYPLSAVPPVRAEASVDGHVGFSVTGYAENDPSAGVDLGSGTVNGPALLNWDAGLPADLCCGKEQSFTPPFGAWTLYYHVSEASR